MLTGGTVGRLLAASFVVCATLLAPAALAGGGPSAVAADAVVALHNRRSLACSGTLIDARHVLTARHCLPITEARFGSSAASGLRVRVVMAATPPNRLDLALLRLERPVQVQPISLAAELGPFPKLVEVGGFGAEDAGASAPRGVLHFRHAVLPSAECDTARARSYGCRPGFELVIPRGRGSDTCQGDSGGPVLERRESGWHVIGVTSRSVSSALLACGDGGVYVRVDSAARWIERQLEREAQDEDRGDDAD